MTDQIVKIEIDQQEAKELASTLIAIMLTTSHNTTLKLAIKMAHQLVHQMEDKEDALGLSIPLMMIETMGPLETKKLVENKMRQSKPEPNPYDQTKN